MPIARNVVKGISTAVVWFWIIAFVGGCLVFGLSFLILCFRGFPC